MMTEEHSLMAMNAISYAMDKIAYEFSNTAICYQEWAIQLKPKLFIDGNKWCALYGDNLQEGVAGFGDSPAKAIEDFNRSFNADLPKKLT